MSKNKTTKLSHEEKVRTIIKTWDNYLKSQEKINELFWEIDLFLITRSISENIIRLKQDNFNLSYDLKILVKELHLNFLIKLNEELVNTISPKLISKFKSLYWLDGDKVEFRVNNKDYSRNPNCHLKHTELKDPKGKVITNSDGSPKKVLKYGLPVKSIFSRLEKYISELQELLNAEQLTRIILKDDLNREQVELYSKYFIQALLFNYKQNRTTLQKKLSRNLISESFNTIRTKTEARLAGQLEEICKEASDFMMSTLKEIENDKTLDFKNFIEQIKSGQTTQQKDYAYNVYGFIDNLVNLPVTDDVKGSFRKNVIELFFRILLYTHLRKDYHKQKPLDDKKDRDVAYKDLLDSVYRSVMYEVNFLKDYFEISDPSRLPKSIIVNFKEPITQEYIARRSLHSKLKNDLWYKLIISFTKCISSEVNTKALKLKSPEILVKIKDTQKQLYRNITFTEFHLLNELLKAINNDFSELLSNLRKGTLVETNNDLKFADMINYVLSSLSTGHYDSFIRNIDFDQFTDTDFTKILENSLYSLIPSIQTYRVITSISHFDLEGEIKTIDKCTYLYDSRIWDSGENNQLDFFSPSNFRGPHKEYADIKYASPFYFMASHTGWGQSVSPKGKMVRHSTRMVNVEEAYGIDDAIYKTKIKASKVMRLLITPWNYYTDMKQSANIKISNQFFIVNDDFTDFNFKDLNHTEIHDEEKMTLKSEAYKQFDKVYLPLLKSNYEVDQNILESINYWQEALWEKAPEKRFFTLIKALTSLLPYDPTSVMRDGQKVYLDILASTINSPYWFKYLQNEVVKIWKKIEEDKTMQRQYKRIVNKSTYYIDLLKNIDKLTDNKSFQSIDSDLNILISKYDESLLAENTKGTRRLKEVELAIWRTKRHSILHHDSIDAYDSFDLVQYNWKLEMLYTELFKIIINARVNKPISFEQIVRKLNI